MNIAELEKYAHFTHIPIVRPKTKEIILQFLEKTNPKKILEIGTAIGYSGSIMLEKIENSTLTTIEKNEIMVEKAKNTFRELGFENRVNLISGDANIILEQLAKSEEMYDFIFLDGPKSHYLTQLPFLLKMLSKNGTIAVDNVLFMGQVLSSEYPKHKHRTTILKLRQFLKEVFDNPLLDAKLHEVEDGLLIISWKNKI